MANIDLLTHVDRRRFLTLAGAVTAGGIAAACTGDESTNAATPTPGSSDHGAAGTPAAGRPKAQGKLAAIYDATLPPLDPNPRKTLVIDATDVSWEVAAGVMLNAWTYDSVLPGKVVHVRQGDTIDFTFRNKSTLGHSIDFHSARTPWDKNYITIVPDEELSFTWTADYPGVFMYHCGTGPVIHHIANGMYGAVVVDPAEPFAPAREYVLVQSEFYLKPGDGGTWDSDVDRMLALQPDFVVFNGSALQYQQQPLPAAPGELIRLHVMNAGPTLFSAFHVIGALFDRVYADGNPANVMRGVQTWTVPPGGGATFELVIPEPGQYPFVTHSFAYTGLGAVGLLQVA
ncbi:MAG: multicopper oxidase domain-containing protein [Dehalococcoidia bacterium]